MLQSFFNFNFNSSYNAPPGDEFAPNFFIEDVYDGEEHTDEEGGETRYSFGYWP